jgi:putative CocE/NonD family hydrolase
LQELNMNTPSSLPGNPPQDVIIHYDVPCCLSDGIVLRADIARPAGDGRWPVLLIRTPYGKATAPGFTTDFTHGARHGYVTIIQDVRGRGASDGKADFRPLIDEGRDGAEAVEWAAALPYSNGKVYMSGQSYLGFVQWAAASERPASLQGINPIVPVGQLRRSFLYCGGVLELELNGYWWTMIGSEAILRREGHNREQQREALRQAGTALEGLAREHGYDSLPLSRFEPVASSASGQQFFDVLKETEDGPTIAATTRAYEYENVTVPALIVAGWYDVFIRTSIDQFVGIRTKGGSEGAKTKSRLIVGPWAHQFQSKMTGEKIYPGTAAIQALNPFGHMGLAARYFSALDEEENTGAPVRIWVMSADKWRDEYEWPIARTVVTPWYLSSGGRANTDRGDGALSPQQGAGGPADSFVYDPSNPVPTRGGAVFAVSCVQGGSDQRPIEQRDDMLVYKSDILLDDVEVTGTPFVELWVTTDVVDTDFVARLVDVYPDGTARLITDGILRARYRDNPDSFKASDPLEPGRPYLMRIELLPTSNLFKAGHRIQLDVTSSCFPRWARNLNIWDEWGGTLDDARIAHQQVLHDDAHRSCILLPIVPGRE